MAPVPSLGVCRAVRLVTSEMRPSPRIVKRRILRDVQGLSDLVRSCHTLDTVITLRIAKKIFWGSILPLKTGGNVAFHNAAGFNCGYQNEKNVSAPLAHIS
jgi:hypothetical protein